MTLTSQPSEKKVIREFLLPDVLYAILELKNVSGLTVTAVFRQIFEFSFVTKKCLEINSRVLTVKDGSHIRCETESV